MDIVLQWILCSYGHFAPTDIELLWTLCSYGHCAPMDIVLLWTLFSHGHFGPMDTVPIWTLFSSGRCAPLDTRKCHNKLRAKIFTWATLRRTDYDGSNKTREYLDGMISNGARCTREIKSFNFYDKTLINMKKKLFTHKFYLNLLNKFVKCYIWSAVFVVLKFGQLGTYIRYTWNFWKCGAGEGCRKSVGPIVWGMKKCYIESSRRGILYIL